MSILHLNLQKKIISSETNKKDLVSIRRAQEADDRKAQLDKKIESYEAALNRMLEVIGESNTDNLIESFREKEDRNFALFNYVSETNAKIERLNDENMRVLIINTFIVKLFIVIIKLKDTTEHQRRGILVVAHLTVKCHQNHYIFYDQHLCNLK
ncbi:unnamed protein product [Trichobilharzia regenti]|nr:unnamed protein product [Trichobilharzia regenti]